MARKKSGEAEARWREVLKRQAKSGLSVRAFCAAEGVSAPSFYSWRRKFRDRKNGSSRPPRAKHSEGATDKDRLFVPLKLLDTSHPLEIIHPLGYRIQVTGEVNPVALRKVIEALDQRGAP